MADDDWAGATFGSPTRQSDDDWAGATFAKPRTVQRAAVSTVPEREAPGLIGAGIAGLAGDVKTGGARLLQGVGATETAKDVEASAGESYARQAQRPLTDIDESWWKGIYEQATASLPSMAPVLAGGAAGAMAAGPVGALVGGTLGAMPQMFGSNLKRQTEEQKIPLAETGAGVAAATALGQSALDSLMGAGLFGGLFKVPAKLATNIVSRMAIKAVEGGLTEGLTEAAQQWLEVLQANPEKARNMPPEVVKEIRDAGIVGAAMGILGGGAGGIKSPAQPVPSTPVGVEAPVAEAPPQTEYWPDGTGQPYESSGMGLPEPGRFKPIMGESDLGLSPPSGPTPAGPRDMTMQDLTAASGWLANGQGLPTKAGEVTPGPDGAPLPDPNFRNYPSGMGVVGRGAGMGLADPNLPWLPHGHGLAEELSPEETRVMGPNLPRPPGWAPNTSALNLPPGMPEQTGKTVFENEFAKLRGAGMNQIQAAANARMAQARYETLGKQLGRSPLSVYQEWNVEVQGPDMKMKLGDRVAQIQTQGVPFKDAVLQAESEIDQPFKRFEQSGQRYDSPEFRSWFGESKVRSEDGTPQVLYHGTSKDTDFGRFKIGRRGAWFTADPESASQYAAENDSMGHRYEDGTFVPTNTAARVFPVNLKIEKPYVLNATDFAELRRAAGDSPNGYKRAEGQFFDRLRQQGYDGVNMGSGTWVVLKTPNQIKSVMNKGAYSSKPGILDQRQRGGATPTPQGNITFQPDRSTVIRLFKTANASTYPHESAHLYLEQMIQYAPQNRQIAADLQAFMDWAGVTDPSQIERKHHEQFARGWEKFLRTGKAPNKSLADVFRQFSEWLKAIYLKATELDVAIPDYMEKVYARLVSTKENLPESTPTGVERSAPNTSQTFGQSSRVDPATLRDTMQRSNDNSGGYFTPEWKIGQAKRLEGQIKHYEEMADSHAKLAERRYSARGNRKSFQIAAKQAQDYRKAAEDARTERAKLMAEASSRTFDQAAPNTSNAAPNPTNRIMRWLSNVFDPFSNVENASEYRKLRSLMSGGTYAAEQAATRAKKLFEGRPLAELNAINSFMETAGANPLTLPATIRQETVTLKNYINGPLKRSLIESGLLPESVAEKNADSYLPRLYLKFVLEDGGVKGARLSRDNVKRRGDKDPIELLAMGEIKDPSVRTFYALFRPLRDLKVMEFLNQVAQHGDWVIPQSLVEWNGRKVTPQWLKEEAVAIRSVRAQPDAEPDPARRTAMTELANRMDQAAADGLAALNQADYDGEQFTKLPDTAEFGPLRGMVVHKQIAEDITGTVNFVKPDNWFDKWFGDRQSMLTKGMSYWKMAKVPFNPPSQIRNIVSNMILLNLSGIPIHKVGSSMIAAAQDMRANGKFYQIAKKYGVGHGTFSEQELYAVTDYLRKIDHAQQGGLGAWKTIAEALGKTGKKVLDMYQLAEVWGKVAKIKHAMETTTKDHPNGMSEEQAVEQANKWLFDYSEVPQAVRRARQSPIGYPFLTFTYKVIPLMAEVARRHPTRFLPYIAMSAMVPMMTAAMNDIDQDDPEKLRKALPKALQKWNDMYLLPWKDDAGRWQFINIGYFMPWQMPVDFGRNMAQSGYHAATGSSREAVGDLGEAIGGTNILSNPLFNIVAALTTGVDPFTKKPIMDKRDPAREQIMDMLGYAWGLAAPSLLAPYGAAGQAYQAATGTGMNRFGEPTNTPTQIGARALGLNTYPVIPDAQRGRNIQQMNREIQDVKSRMTYSLRDRSLTMEQRRSMVEDFKGEIKDRTEQVRKYIKESQPSPRLQAATARP